MRNFLLLAVFPLTLGAQPKRVSSPKIPPTPAIQSGPMVGFSDHREVLLWVQTNQPTQVNFRFWDLKQPDKKRNTSAVQTQKSQGYVAKIIADSLLPGTRYGYEVCLNGKPQSLTRQMEFQTQALWQFRTDPPEMNFAVGSCAYVNEPFWDRPGKGYGDSMIVFQTLAQQKPDFMLWLGDNTYTREGDWNSWGGMLHRYSHTRSLPEMQALLSATHHYATWDDHDYGPNDADRGFWNKETTRKAFDLFWGNPQWQPLGPGPVTNTFSWGDCQFFLLDDRWFRAPNSLKDSTKSYLGKEQIDWLMDALTFSKATFKFIACGGQVLNDAAVFENYAAYPLERRNLIERITKAKIPGVIFLTGDRHHAELCKLERPGTYPLYDLTTSPLTAGVHDPGNEPNTLRLPGTLYNGRNFAMINIRGPQKERVLTMRIVSNLGKLVWEKEIRAGELK